MFTLIFFWRLYGVTRSIEFPNSRCSDSIEDLGDSYGCLFFISLDAPSGYHQIKVRTCDQENLNFLTPEGKKKWFIIIPFGSKNAPTFYTTMMKVLYDEWIIILNKKKHMIQSDISLTNIYCNNKTGIDDTLLYSNHIPILLHYLSYVTQVFNKYRFYFKLIKYDLFLPRIEYVGHDLITAGNYSAQSKFQLIKNWSLPSYYASLLSFIGLCALYSNYAL